MSIMYREPETRAELEALFRFRHAVYSEDAFLNTISAASAGDDISLFDACALHFAAFDNGNPVACIRIVTGAETNFTPMINELRGMEHAESGEQLFPFQSFYPDTGWSAAFIDSLKGRNAGEVGRLAIHKQYRKEGKVLGQLIPAFILYCKAQGIQTGFGVCTLQLARYYRKFGFTLAEGAVPFIHGDLPEAVIVRFDG